MQLPKRTNSINTAFNSEESFIIDHWAKRLQEVISTLMRRIVFQLSVCKQVGNVFLSGLL